MTAPITAPSGERDGRSSRWDDHREQRRRLILDAAAEVVESHAPGAELMLQDVAERAGVVHTVVRRHFGGRLELVRSVQADVLEQAFALVTTPIDPEASLHDGVLGYMHAVVAWVDSHRALHALIERELGDGKPSELNLAIGIHTERLVGYAVEIARLFGIEIAGEVEASWRLMFAGIIGQVRATVSYWVAQTPRVVSADHVAGHLAATISRQVADAIGELGQVLDPRLPIAPQAMAAFAAAK